MLAARPSETELSMKTANVLVFIPLIPAMPVLATWWLPWERWLPSKVPKRILGTLHSVCCFRSLAFRDVMVGSPHCRLLGSYIFGNGDC